jgi:uncharacterized 2Fe-2S/4Fe-4S cluster protein (DUF4445 family)
MEGAAGHPFPPEAGLLGEKAVREGLRLACRVKVAGDLHVLIEPEQILELDHTGKWKEVWDSPLWLPDRINPDRTGFGVAVDMGTTSVASGLVDLAKCRPLDIVTSINPQLPWGEDIISRLDKAAADIDTAAKLQKLLWEALRDQLRSLCLRNGISGGRVDRMVLVGNSAMRQLALGAPAKELLSPPYSPGDLSSKTIYPEDLPVDPGVGKGTKIYFPPLIGGYAGSDALASILAAEYGGGAGSGALLDVGTNTEIAVWTDGKVLVATAPSGPAFEGGHIAGGMRAEAGAVWKVEITGDDVEFQVIGDGVPRGICGTGMIDVLAALLRQGILDRTGLIKAAPYPFIKDNAFVFGGGKAVALTGSDIAALQKAKSAISTVFEMLLKELGTDPERLDKVFLAGAFGSRLNIPNAVKTGLLPPLDSERYVLAGNTALVGACMMLVSEDLQQRAEKLAATVGYCDLAGDPEFEEAFIDGLYFPDP